MSDSDKKVKQAITKAEGLLPGTPSPEGEKDPRWQALIKVGEYIPDHPLEVWHFIEKWGKSRSADVRMAIATCLLEHLLEYHFSEYFPLVKIKCQQSKLFADTFTSCGEFGQTNEKKNSKAFLGLMNEICRY
jgi:hypothetical protein